jgi:hypothetical protein
LAVARALDADAPHVHDHRLGDGIVLGRRLDQRDLLDLRRGLAVLFRPRFRFPADIDFREGADKSPRPAGREQ